MGKGDWRRPEAAKGAFDAGFGILDWSNTTQAPLPQPKMVSLLNEQNNWEWVEVGSERHRQLEAR